VPTSGTDERLWQRLERYLKAGKLIPILGPGCVTFGKEEDSESDQYDRVEDIKIRELEIIIRRLRCSVL